MGYSRVNSEEDIKVCRTCAFFWHWNGEVEYNFCAKWNEIIPKENELSSCERWLKEKRKGNVLNVTEMETISKGAK
jgi:hypothetical protein